MARLAGELGVARPTLANNLRVLTLPDVALERIASGEMAMGVAKELLVLRGDQCDHTDVMEQVVAECEVRGLWTRKAVRGYINRKTLYLRDWGILEGEDHSTYRNNPVFDVEAFKAEHKGCLHRLPTYDLGDASVSVLATCNVAAWDEWHEAAVAELRAVEEADAVDDDDRTDPRQERWLESALAKDPVWQGIAALRSEPGPNLPQNDREREALGSRAQFLDWYGQPFYKELRAVDIRSPSDLAHAEQEKRDGVPPWFPDLEECMACVIGAKWTRLGYPAQTVPICTNREHYLEKLQGRRGGVPGTAAGGPRDRGCGGRRGTGAVAGGPQGPEPGDAPHDAAGDGGVQPGAAVAPSLGVTTSASATSRRWLSGSA